MNINHQTEATIFNISNNRWAKLNIEVVPVQSSQIIRKETLGLQTRAVESASLKVGKSLKIGKKNRKKSDKNLKNLKNWI